MDFGSIEVAPPERYKELSNSDKPFVCLSCSDIQLRRMVAELSASVRSLKEELQEALSLHDKVSSIENAVAMLKETQATRVNLDALSRAAFVCYGYEAAKLTLSVQASLGPQPLNKHPASPQL